ncbi:hypothetical protein [Sanguibacter antarcticus]|uniref:DUF4352 domain-containing protein n=1 Tax=Sanguibacter antarcticus TaxID=372484 RepID=A0A2A9E7G6_9MICO|nr:hypothetical protein [Sanguibacter antarcticus]PFG34576.1 hypothetical protein ATL42_2493 [Sanguibacter antarcticus]
MRISRGIATLSIATLALVGVSSCSSDEPEETATTAEETDAPEADEAEPETAEPEEDASDEPAGSGSTASWAKPVTTPGTLLTTVTSDQFTLDVYQVGVTQATKTGQFADADGNPIITEGSDIVFVNYIVTNTSGETIPIGASLVDVSARYADWPYMQGMDSIVDNALFEEQEVNSSGAATDSYVDPYVLQWEPGTQFSYGENFLYQAGSPITFDVTMVPVDDEGDLVHDEKVEVTADTAIE